MKKIIFTPTGEVRPLKKGDWFKNTHEEMLTIQTVNPSSSNSFPIYTRTEEEYKWKPEKGYPYWTIDYDFKPMKSIHGDYGSDYARIEAGNCFPTKEACEAFIKEKGLR